MLTGCAPTTEIDKLMIVSGMSIDYTDGLFDVTTQIIDMKNSDQTELSPINLSTKGKTIIESIGMLPGIEGQRLYYTHAKLILVNDDYFKTKGVSHLIDLLNYEPRFRSSISIAVTETKASDVINTTPQTDPIPCYSIADSIKESSKMLRTPDVPYYKFLNETLEEGIDGVLPIINTIKNEKDESLPIVEGTALFKDTIMVSSLTPKQTTYLLIIKDPKENSIFTIDNYSFLIDKAESDISYENKEVYISLKIELSLLEGDKITNDELEKLINQDCEKGISDVIQLCKDWGCDPLGIGRHIKRYHTSTWKEIYPENWENFYKNLKINVDIDSSIIPSSKLSGDED